MSLIMGQVIPDQWVLSALEIEKLNFISLFGIYFHCYLVLFSTQVSDLGPLWSSCLKFFEPCRGLTFFFNLFYTDVKEWNDPQWKNCVTYSLNQLWSRSIPLLWQEFDHLNASRTAIFMIDPTVCAFSPCKQALIGSLSITRKKITKYFSSRIIQFIVNLRI